MSVFQLLEDIRPLVDPLIDFMTFCDIIPGMQNQSGFPHLRPTVILETTMATHFIAHLLFQVRLRWIPVRFVDSTKLYLVQHLLNF